jgi:hypothetical protein
MVHLLLHLLATQADGRLDVEMGIMVRAPDWRPASPLSLFSSSSLKPEANGDVAT